MIIIISPAKKQIFYRKREGLSYTKPQFFNDSLELVNILRKMNWQKLMNLMSISSNLAKLNYDRFQTFTNNISENNSNPALLMFDGDVYKNIAVDTFSNSDIEYSQQKLFILSGLYGLLKPLDLIQPHRLEMGTNFVIDKTRRNLYQFWQDKLTTFLSKQKEDIIINLASSEYSKIIDNNKFKGKILTINFKELRNNQYKNIGILAKRARGKMVNFLIKNRVNNIEDIKKFNVDDYIFNESMSDNNQWVFYR